MSASGSISDFYEFSTKLCQRIDNSTDKFVVSSLGKQSLGKSYFLNSIFSRSIPTKDGQLVSKGTTCFHHLRNGDYHLLDMEGLDSSEGSTQRDYFNFLFVFSVSDLILLQVSHQDLENRKFIDHFSFMWFQSFCPIKRTFFEFRAKIPKIVLLVKDPRWDTDTPATFNEYEKLVCDFQKKVMKNFEKYCNEVEPFYQETLELAEIQRFKNREWLGEKDFEFKIEKFFVVFYQKVGFGKSKRIQYYSMKKKQDFIEIKPSKFKALIKIIDGLKKEFIDGALKKIYRSSELSIQMMSFNLLPDYEKYQGVEINKRWICDHVFLEVMNDFTYSMTNHESIMIFLERFNTISKEISSIFQNCEYKAQGWIFYDNPSLDSSQKLNCKGITDENISELRKIIQKKEMLDIYDLIIKHLKLVSLKKFLNFFPSELNVHQNLVFNTFFSLFLLENESLVKEQLSLLNRRILLIESCIFDDESKKILQLYFSKKIKPFDCTFSVLENLYDQLIQCLNRKSRQILNHDKDSEDFYLLLTNIFKFSEFGKKFLQCKTIFKPYADLSVNEIEKAMNLVKSFFKSKFSLREDGFFLNRFLRRSVKVIMIERVISRIPVIGWFWTSEPSRTVSLYETFYPEANSVIISAKSFKIVMNGYVKDESITVLKDRVKYYSQFEAEIDAKVESCVKVFLIIEIAKV